MNDTMNHFDKKKSLIVLYERINTQRAERITKKSTKNKHTEILSGTQTSRATQTVTTPSVGLYIRTLGTQIGKEIV